MTCILTQMGESLSLLIMMGDFRTALATLRRIEQLGQKQALLLRDYLSVLCVCVCYLNVLCVCVCTWHQHLRPVFSFLCLCVVHDFLSTSRSRRRSPPVSGFRVWGLGFQQKLRMSQSLRPESLFSPPLFSEFGVWGFSRNSES
jgi:hypothetical protein